MDSWAAESMGSCISRYIRCSALNPPGILCNTKTHDYVVRVAVYIGLEIDDKPTTDELVYEATADYRPEDAHLLTQAVSILPVCFVLSLPFYHEVYVCSLQHQYH